MRILQLNTWGGIMKDEMLAFLRTHTATTDIFCLQEVIDADIETGPVDYEYMNGMRTTRKAIEKALPDFTLIYSPFTKGITVTGKPVPNNFAFGNALCVRKGIRILSYGEVFVHKHYNSTENTGGWLTAGNALQRITVENHGNTLTIINVHGLAANAPKTDTPERIAQSHKIRAVMESIKGDSLVCGDFNLDPDTESIAIVKEGYRDLISEHKIQSTRSSKFPKEYKQWADYVFTTSTLKIKHFEVLKDEVSDHLPLVIDVE